MMDSRERFSWLVELLEIKTNDRILEIGCGVGFAVEAITPFLKRGKIVAIDRSATAISKAVDRNQKAVTRGKATIKKTELLAFTDATTKYDKVFCFNINFFWTKKSIAQEMV